MLVEYLLAKPASALLYHLVRARGPVASEQVVVQRIVDHLLPCAIDWQQLTYLIRHGGASHYELPLMDRALAEVVVAGVELRSARLTRGAGGVVIGQTAILMPAAEHEAAYRSAETFLEHVVAKLADKYPEWGYRNIRDPAVLRGRVADRLQILRKMGETTPYLAVIDQESHDPEDVWRVVATLDGPRALPELRVVRMRGKGAGEAEICALLLRLIPEGT